MTSAPVSIDPPRERHSRFDGLQPRHAYAALAIASMWIAVVFTSVFAGDLVTTTPPNQTTVPAGVIVAFFAFLATIPVAAVGLRESNR